MAMHSKYLIHWTGRDFHNKDYDITPKIREKYLDRLCDNCEHGLYMRKGRETIYGVGESNINADIARVCLSEIRLSQAEEHAGKYGMLGIGFYRNYVIERGGNPVLYVRNGDSDMITQNIAFIHRKLKTMVEGDNKDTEKEMLGAVRQVMGFMKGMSERANDLGYLLYEEMEWRIVHSNTFEQYFTAVDINKHIYRASFQPQDIKILVFPDYDTKEMAMERKEIKDFFGNHFPMMTTIKDCLNF